jgi:hypothetical protein
MQDEVTGGTMPEHELTETIARVAAELAAAPLSLNEAARLAPRLADLLAGLRALDELDLNQVEPATVLWLRAEG